MRSQNIGRLAALAVAVALVGCSDETDGPASQEFTIEFAARVGDEPFACGQSYAGHGAQDNTIEAKDFRFYVSNIRLLASDGREVPFDITPDGLWQHDDVALLDFEDGTGGCIESGTTEMRDRIVGMAPAGDYTELIFDLGVPFELNHQDVTAAPSPLNLGAMFWVWQGGYKFLRIDLLNDQPAPDNGWNIHLGSTMCQSASAVTPPDGACGRPNRATVRLTDFDPTADVVVADLAALVDGVDIVSDTPDTALGCQSFPNDETECVALFPNLGLDYESGRCIDDCGGQTFFRAEARN